MELCVDNPREGFADLFATHPSVENRIKALVQYAGGHDSGPLALPSDEADVPEAEAQPDQLPPPVPRGPWDDASRPPTGPVDAGSGPSEGPWGRHN
jgi:heat shock protein HtpX